MRMLMCVRETYIGGCTAKTHSAYLYGDHYGLFMCPDNHRYYWTANGGAAWSTFNKDANVMVDSMGLLPIVSVDLSQCSVRKNWSWNTDSTIFYWKIGIKPPTKNRKFCRMY